MKTFFCSCAKQKHAFGPFFCWACRDDAIRAAVEEEREACAKLCDERANHCPYQEPVEACIGMAAAIRARGTKMSATRMPHQCLTSDLAHYGMDALRKRLFDIRDPAVAAYREALADALEQRAAHYGVWSPIGEELRRAAEQIRKGELP